MFLKPTCAFACITKFKISLPEPSLYKHIKSTAMQMADEKV